MRLNVFISRSGKASRRKADVLIKSGKVKVNGKIMRQPWYDVIKGDAVEVDQVQLKTKNPLYVVFNKPKGVTTTLRDRFASKTVDDYLSAQLKGIFPVGRLDKDSEGLLILTNDGDLSFCLTHPKFAIEKEYSLQVRPRVKADDLKCAQRGIRDKGELLKIEKAFIDETYGDITSLRVIIREGKKRHLRRLFSGLGFKVISLKRIRIAGLRLSNLKSGELKSIKRSKFIDMLGIKI